MKSHPTEPRSKRDGRTATVVLMVFVLAVVYALGVGPIAKLESKGALSPKAQRFWESFYAPLSYVVGHNVTVGRFYLWYFYKMWRIPKPN